MRARVARGILSFAALVAVQAVAAGWWASRAEALGPGIASARWAFALVERAPAAVADGQVWRLVSAMFVHLTTTHVLFSSVSIGIAIGVAPHPRPASSLAAAFAGGLVAGAVAVAVGGPHAVGASGAVAALVGLTWAHPATRPAALAATLPGVAGLLAAVFSGPTDHIAHGVGLSAGVLFGLVLPRMPDAAHRVLVGAVAVTTALGLCLAVRYATGCAATLEAFAACVAVLE